jgi:hypothetical protein
MASRLVLLALAVVGAAVGIQAQRADHRCAEVKATAAEVPLRQPAAVARAAADRCARRMTRSSPDDYLGWLVVWRLSGARQALARAHALNPRGTPAPH